MSITYTDTKKAEFEEFKKNGGIISFEIDPEDISSSREFESDPSLQSKLATGFELPPTSMIQILELQALIQVHGSAWSCILAGVYLAGGKVIYKRKTNGKYEAICSIPASS